ncbi:hypothetical protein V8G54_029933 [Vigna mungo]|uniref:Uncharacterized protein n=1 Tax=Vigna mungo TaxID=3915 RepID=A0AAQ3RLX9_VIGMU
MCTNLNDATNLLLPNGSKILQGKAVVLESIHKLLHSDPGLHPHSLPLLVHFQYPIHQRQVHHSGPRKPDTVRGQPRPDRTDSGPLLVRLPHHALQLLHVLRLEEVASLHLVRPAPVRHRVQVLRQRRVPEDLRLLVLGIVRQGEAVIGGGTAEEEQRRVARVLAGFCIGGGGGFRHRRKSAEEHGMRVVASESDGALQK